MSFFQMQSLVTFFKELIVLDFIVIKSEEVGRAEDLRPCPGSAEM